MVGHPYTPLSEEQPRTQTQTERPNFTTLDVFTTTPYAGNPLAIILLPTSSDLSKAQKQLIAREFNLSESIFLHQRENKLNEYGWEVEIFTTVEELPFAGHPVIGAAFYVLAHLSGASDGDLKSGTLLTRAGSIAISQTQHGGVQAIIPHNIHLHSRTLFDVPQLSMGFSAHSAIHDAELRAPLVSIVKGMTFLLIQLPDLDLLSRLIIGGQRIDFGGVLDAEDGWGESFVAKYYYVVLRELENGGATQVRTRMLEQQLEDPATGSAACTLSCYLALKAGKSSTFEITQGVEMGRRSDIGVDVELHSEEPWGGGKGVKTVKLGGSAVVIMEGSLKI